MIPNKTNYLIHFKPEEQANWQEEPELPPLWFEEYYSNQGSLKFASTKSIYIQLWVDDELTRLIERLRWEKGIHIKWQLYVTNSVQ
jgi:hypothetical protein